jgi:hypothetical protein
MIELKDIVAFKKQSTDDKLWDLYQAVGELQKLQPNKYTAKERVINYASLIGTAIAVALSSMGLTK